MSDTLSVYYYKELIGTLRITKGSQYVFSYTEEWLIRDDAIPISISIPLTPGGVDEEKSMAFFSNLLPESKIRETLAKKLRISDKDSYGLLEVIGGECAGALSILPEGKRYIEEGEYVEIPNSDLGDLFDNVSKRPFLAGDEGVRLSLAGAQDKLPVYLHDGTLYLPKGGFASSHIIKPKIRDNYPHSVINEAFCMGLSQELGLPVPVVTVLRNADEPFYVIERYDRIEDESGSIIRLHQEDFCQALGVPPEYKYEENGGPSLKDCFKLVEENSTNPAIDRLNLIKWVMFNVLISNADAHAKNIALLYEDGNTSLAPFYDLLCKSSDIYPELTDKFSMRIGEKNNDRYLLVHDWKALADSIGVKFSIFPVISEELIDDLESKIVTVKEKVCIGKEEEGFIDKITDVIRKRRRLLLGIIKGD